MDETSWGRRVPPFHGVGFLGQMVQTSVMSAGPLGRQSMLLVQRTGTRFGREGNGEVSRIVGMCSYEERFSR